MDIDWDELAKMAGELGKDALTTLKPYLPALAREGPDVYEGFIRHVMDDDWPAVNELMYEKMTTDERRELENQAYQNALLAARASFRRKELMKEMLLKLALSALVKLI